MSYAVSLIFYSFFPRSSSRQGGGVGADTIPSGRERHADVRRGELEPARGGVVGGGRAAAPRGHDAARAGGAGRLAYGQPPRTERASRRQGHDVHLSRHQPGPRGDQGRHVHALGLA